MRCHRQRQVAIRMLRSSSNRMSLGEVSVWHDLSHSWKCTSKSLATTTTTTTSSSSSSDKKPEQKQKSPSRKRPRGPHMTPSGKQPSPTESNAPTSGNTSSNNNNKSDRFINHIINGGTPCDPSPPPFQLANFGEDSLYTLVLLRHGESEWNLQNKYTGWCDVDLTSKGKQEARAAGRLLYENGIEIDHAFTSVLKRASFSCNMALNTAKQHWVGITKSWRLNERCYGRYALYLLNT